MYVLLSVRKYCMAEKGQGLISSLIYGKYRMLDSIFSSLCQSVKKKKKLWKPTIYDIQGYYFFSLYLPPILSPLTLFLFSTPSFFPFLSFCPKRLAPWSGSWCRNFSKQCSSPLCGMKKEAKLWSFCQAPLDKWADREAVRALSRFFVLNQWSLPKGHPTLLQPLI